MGSTAEESRGDVVFAVVGDSTEHCPKAEEDAYHYPWLPCEELLQTSKQGPPVHFHTSGILYVQPKSYGS